MLCIKNTGAVPIVSSFKTNNSGRNQQPVSDNNIPQPDDIVKPTTEKNSAFEPRYSLRKGEPDKNPNEAKEVAKKSVNPFIPNKKDKPKAHTNPLLEEKRRSGRMIKKPLTNRAEVV